jgi:hypothetical protein
LSFCFGGGRTMEVKMDNTLKYSVQLAMLKKLKSRDLITEFEYDLVKDKLKKKYRIFDELIAG